MQNALDFSLRGITKKIGVISLVFCLSVIPALPRDLDSVIPAGNWGAVESLQKGTRISVRMTSQDRMEGTFLGLDAESIHLKMDNQERIFPRNTIAEVRQLGIPDKRLNGTLIGLGIGALTGGIAAGASEAPFSGEDAWGVLFVAVGIVIGSALGFITDTMIKGSKLLYRK